jgi:hypothetical protein
MRGVLAVVLPGFYAWGACVAWPVFGTEAASPVARISALCALGALLGGPILGRHDLRAGRALGVLAFLGLSAAAWGALGAGLSAQLDPLRGALGALAFGLFALGWGSFPGRDHLPEDDPHAVSSARLVPRARLSLGTALGFAALLIGALGLPLLAWRVENPKVALLGHAAALAASVGSLNVGTRVLLAPSLHRRTPVPRWWLGILLLWLFMGGVVWLL